MRGNTVFITRYEFLAISTSVPSSTFLAFYIPIHQCFVSGSDRDSVSESGQWIRIRIRNPDPYPGGQMTHKNRKKEFLV